MLIITSVARLGSIALVVSTFVKSSVAGWIEREGWDCEGPSKKPDKYVGLERCGDDRATRLRCVEVADNDVKDGSKFRFTTTFGGKDKNKCGGDTPLCKQDWQAWAYTVTLPPDYDGVQPLKTSCIAGEPPQGFDHAEGGWACPAVKIPSSFTSDDPFLSKCDPTGKWYWTCAELQLDERNVGEFQQVHRCGESEDDPSPETTECKPLGLLKGRRSCSMPVAKAEDAFPA